MGVRRSGKTTLCHSMLNTRDPGNSSKISDMAVTEYFDCELPRVRRLFEDPQEFLDTLKGRRVILDEVHRLDNPSELLKIAADYYHDIKILATGSSTLGASLKFKDTLAGRKEEVWLTPMMSLDLQDFKDKSLHPSHRDLRSIRVPRPGGTPIGGQRPTTGDIRDLRHRFLYGGLPPFFLAKSFPERDFQEWLDAYWAKDIQELFRLERRYSFQKFLELLLAQSGGIFEATRFSKQCEISRTTITNYLSVLEATFVIHVLRPFSTHKATEIVSAPKVYGFDTGFVCYFRGIHELRAEDLGFLWEHYVLNELHAMLQSQQINYWRDKRGHEVDFILSRRGASPIAIECKWQDKDFEPDNLKIFRRQYPGEGNYVVANNVDKPYKRNYGEVTVRFININHLTNKGGDL